MKNRVITISREFGSGGRTIGKRAAAELGIPCYDNELLQKIAHESGFHESYIQEAGVQTTFSGTRQTVCGSLSMRIWSSVPNASCRSMANGRNPRSSG